MMRSPLPLAVLILLSVGSATEAQPPAAPVVIYLHGRIIEEQGPDAVSPEFGAYGYHAILDSLRAGGFQVVSGLRPRGADMDESAARVILQIDSLLKAGVTPARIAVVGFSKGGGIAMLASARLRRSDITFVFMASCSEANAELDLRGRLLSIYEESDPLGRSCSAVFARTPKGSVVAERRIATGLKHGAFYQPRSEWLEPVRAWILRRQ